MTTVYALAHKETGQMLSIDWRNIGSEGENEWFFTDSECEGDMIWNTRNYFNVTNLRKENALGDYERPEIPDNININDYKIVELTYRDI